MELIDGRKLVKLKMIRFIKQNQRVKLESLLADDVNLNLIKNEKYFNPFVLAIRQNNLNLIEFMMEKGLKLNREEANNAESVDFGPKKRKYDSGSDDSDSVGKSSTNNQQTYPNVLVEAIKCCNYEAVNLLISLNVNVDSSNYRMIPLQIAYNMYTTERDKYLMERSVFETNKYEVSIC